MTKVLLYSGGMDSWLISKIWKPDVKLYIDIEGSYSEIEKSKLPEDVEIVKFPLGQFETPSKYIPLRNLYFLMIASNYGDELCLGAIAGDRGVKDKTPEFFDKTEEMLNYLLEKQSNQAEAKKIVIEKEFLYKSKSDLVQMYLEQGGTLEEIAGNSFSCYKSEDGKPCFDCKPCFRKFVTLAHFGYEYPEEAQRKIYEYAKREMVPYSKNTNNTYYRDRQTEGKIAEEQVQKLYAKFGGDIERDRLC